MLWAPPCRRLRPWRLSQTQQVLLLRWRSGWLVITSGSMQPWQLRWRRPGRLAACSVREQARAARVAAAGRRGCSSLQHSSYRRSTSRGCRPANGQADRRHALALYHRCVGEQRSKTHSVLVWMAFCVCVQAPVYVHAQQHLLMQQKPCELKHCISVGHCFHGSSTDAWGTCRVLHINGWPLHMLTGHLPRMHPRHELAATHDDAEAAVLYTDSAGPG